MPIQFARLDYVKNHAQIPVHFNVVKQNPEDNLNWYIDKYNPLAISECAIAGELGVKVLLPVTQSEAVADAERTRKIIMRAISSLRDSGVEIIIPPENIQLKHTAGMYIADGTHLLPFLLCGAIKKWAESTKRLLRRFEAVVVHNSLPQTECVLYHICEDLNFVTVMDMRDDRERLLNTADRIFDDTGLNVVIRGTNKAALKTADIVVLTANDDFDNAYKRGALIFDLSGDVVRRKTLISRRPDIYVVDSLIANYKNSGISLPLFELALYAKERNFRQILAKGYNSENGGALSRAIGRMGLSVFSLTQLGKVVRF